MLRRPTRPLLVLEALSIFCLCACGRETDATAKEALPPSRGSKESGKEALHVDGLLRLLPEDRAWFSEPKPRLKLAVDRHRNASQLVRESFSTKHRDSRRAVSLKVMQGEEWTSPLVDIPREASLCFSYLPFVEALGGLLGGITWQVFIEVPGVSKVEIWRSDELLRPPTGGSWREAEVDLGKLAGRTARFVFVAKPHEDSPFLPPTLRAAYGNPMVVTKSSDRPNLLVISIDTLRRDAISPYSPGKETPNLERLAERGVVADSFWSPAPWTLPAYASLFTAEYPSTHGAGLDRTVEPLPGEELPTIGIASGIPSLVGHFADLGYYTQAIYANGHLNMKSGIDRGFDGYIWYGVTGRTAADLFDTWARSLSGRPFFAFVQMFDPHWPYTVPASFERRPDVPDSDGHASIEGAPTEMLIKGVPEADRDKMSAMYGVLVRYMDEQVGHILDSLERQGLADDTLVVFHVDHGEELWDHGEWWHGHSHYSELLQVPLILSWPGRLPEGIRVGQTIRGIDLLPTALELLGLPAPPHATEGRSVAPIFRGESTASTLPALGEFELYGPGGDVALTEYPWRLIVQPLAPWNAREQWIQDPESIEGGVKVMLFNIAEDPREQVDVAKEHPDLVAEMQQRAEAIQQRALERRQGEHEQTDFDDADLDDMMGIGLGYTAR